MFMLAYMCNNMVKEEITDWGEWEESEQGKGKRGVR